MIYQILNGCAQAPCEVDYKDKMEVNPAQFGSNGNISYNAATGTATLTSGSGFLTINADFKDVFLTFFDSPTNTITFGSSSTINNANIKIGYSTLDNSTYAGGQSVPFPTESTSVSITAQEFLDSVNANADPDFTLQTLKAESNLFVIEIGAISDITFTNITLNICQN